MMIAIIPPDSRGGFVLTHPDFDKHNFMILEDGTLSGILDWDGVTSMPRGCGYARYPSWIVQDWNPFDYQWIDPDMNEDSIEDSRETLRGLRKSYHEYIRGQSTLDGEDNLNAHVMDAITLASSDELYGVNIINGLMKRCFKDMPFDADYVWSPGGEIHSCGSKGTAERADEDSIADENSYINATKAKQQKPKLFGKGFCRSLKRIAVIGGPGSPRSALGSYWRSLVSSACYVPAFLVKLIVGHQNVRDENEMSKDRRPGVTIAKTSTINGGDSIGPDANLSSQRGFGAEGESVPGAISLHDSCPSKTAGDAKGSRGDIGDGKLDSWCYNVYQGLALNVLRSEHIQIFESRFKEMFAKDRIFE
ncbi:MAG: hypothetical protein MMC23_006507 [Stictis urceolatum]|nr:hypothetical protein [Stictis urceolata]